MRQLLPHADQRAALPTGAVSTPSGRPLLMSLPDPAELKRKLRAAGFEVYRTVAEQVLLAERVRDNLIMDSGVAAHLAREDSLIAVEVTVRAQASHFPGAAEDQIWSHARSLSNEFTRNGYSEEEARSASVPDPSDPAQSLDISYEIRLRRQVEDIDSLFEELRAALGRRRSTGDD